jgi:hypothetical protein
MTAQQRPPITALSLPGDSFAGRTTGGTDDDGPSSRSFATTDADRRPDISVAWPATVASRRARRSNERKKNFNRREERGRLMSLYLGRLFANDRQRIFLNEQTAGQLPRAGLRDFRFDRLCSDLKG